MSKQRHNFEDSYLVMSNGRVRMAHDMAPWGNPPYPPAPVERKTFSDYWDALFGRRETFAKVDLDGTYCICELHEAADIAGEWSEDNDYTITQVRMTRRQFEALPEFAGF